MKFYCSRIKTINFVILHMFIIVAMGLLICSKSPLFAQTSKVDSLLKQGCELGKKKNYLAAFPLFHQVLKVDPTNVKALYFFALSAKKLGKDMEFEKARQILLNLKPKIGKKLPESQFASKVAKDFKRKCLAAQRIIGCSCSVFRMENPDKPFPVNLQEEFIKLGIQKKIRSCPLGCEYIISEKSNELLVECSKHGTFSLKLDSPRPQKTKQNKPMGLTVFKENGLYGIKKIFGEILVEPKFERIHDDFHRGIKMFGAKMGGKWGVIDLEGNWALQPDYDYIAKTDSEKISSLEKDGKYGFFDMNIGKVLCKPRFKSIGVFNSGLAWASEDEKFGYVNKKAEWKISPIFEKAKGFSKPFKDSKHGLFSFAACKYNGKWGFINKDGKWSIEPEFLETFVFENGLAAVLVKQKGKNLWGFIDASGKMVVSPYFKSRDLPPYYDGKHIVAPGVGKITIAEAQQKASGKSDLNIPDSEIYAKSSGGYITYHNRRTGEIILDGPSGIAPKRGGSFCEGIAIYKKGSKYGYFSRKGEVVTEPIFEKAQSFSEGFAAVRVDKKWGFIDKTGAVTIEPVFEDAKRFGQGLAGVKVDGKWGFIDQSGKEVISPRFSSVKFFKENRCPFLDKNYGYIDLTGKTIIQPQFQSVGFFSNGVAPVCDRGQWGVIDLKGKFVVDPQFQNVAVMDSNFDVEIGFSEGLLCVLQDDQWGYVDKSGSVVIPFQYLSARPFLNGLAPVKSIGHVCFYIDKTGKTIDTKIKPKFKRLVLPPRRH